MKNSFFETRDRRRKIGDIFRAVLSTPGLAKSFDEMQLYIGSDVIFEKTGNHQKLSNAIFANMFPKEPSPCDLFHYTKLPTLKNIASSGKLRLYVLKKRIGQGELFAFARDHGLKGYYDSSQGNSYYKELSEDIFYTSFARTSTNDEAMMWTLFGDGGCGARLKFRVDPKVADLRSIQYEQPSPDIAQPVERRAS
jgi:hypothetical protein